VTARPPTPSAAAAPAGPPTPPAASAAPTGPTPTGPTPTGPAPTGPPTPSGSAVAASREVTPPVAEPAWLQLREPVDRRSRSVELARELAAALRPGPLRILDVGCGTGSTTRWLAPLLPGPQRWVMLDRDPVLLALVAERTAGTCDRDGTPVDVATRHDEITSLTARDLAGMSAVTASALVDLLTADEIGSLAAACAAARVPALITLTVTGQVEIDPPDPVDHEVAAAFDAHQRRTVAGRALLGPGAAAATVEAFERAGMTVRTVPTPWLLGPDDRPLAARWLTERVAAAVEHEPQLEASARTALTRRVNATPLRAVISHIDLLAAPIGGPP
jgi:hypothetical protein